MLNINKTIIGNEVLCVVMKYHVFVEMVSIGLAVQIPLDSVV